MTFSHPTIGIIGFGRFGILTASILSKKFRVKIYDCVDNAQARKKVKKIKVRFATLQEAAGADIVVLSVPISKTEKLLKKISPLLKKGALVVDTCSVKVYPSKWMEKYLPEYVDILATHPMFGPVTTKFDFEKQTWKLKGLQIVLCPLRMKKHKLSKIVKYLIASGIKPIITTPEDHDKQNAATLGLVHYLGRALINIGIAEQKIYTPGYTDLLKILPHTNSDNWQLFYDMHNYNPYTEDLRAKFLKSVEKIDNRIDKAKHKDELEYCRYMIDKIDYRFIELLTERFKYIKRIKELKKKKKLPVVDKAREALIIRQKLKHSKLNRSFMKNLYDLIFKASYKIQK
jgi:prephenate dehydrogenase